MIFLVQAGVMGTHDEETRKFFKHSSVMCVLSPRYASNKMSFLKQQASVRVIRGLIPFSLQNNSTLLSDQFPFHSKINF